MTAKGDGGMNITDIVMEAARKHSLSPQLVAAIIYQESKGNVYAYRFEPNFFKRLDLRPRNLMAGHIPEFPSLANEKRARAVSYGLMQILGETARVMGFKNQYLLALIEPKTNVNLGCAYLKKLMEKAKARGLEGRKQERQALLWYNGGGDKTYPDKIFSHIESLVIYDSILEQSTANG